MLFHDFGGQWFDYFGYNMGSKSGRELWNIRLKRQFENRFKYLVCPRDIFSPLQPSIYLPIWINKYFHLSSHLLYEVLIFLSKTGKFHSMTWLNYTNVCHRIVIIAFHFVYIFFSPPWMVDSPTHRLDCILFIFPSLTIIWNIMMLKLL